MCASYVTRDPSFAHVHYPHQCYLRLIAMPHRCVFCGELIFGPFAIEAVTWVPLQRNGLVVRHADGQLVMDVIESRYHILCWNRIFALDLDSRVARHGGG